MIGAMARKGPWVIIALGITLLSQAGTTDVEVIRKEIEPGVMARVKHGRNLGLEVRPPAGDRARPFLQKYLASQSEWTTYRNRLSVFIPLDRLKPEAQRAVILLVYEGDVVDELGWTHTVIDDRETLWSLCEWVTGRGTNYKTVMADPHNRLRSAALHRGQTILIPAALLSAVMKRHTAPRYAQSPPERDVLDGKLDYASDSRGEHAIYRLRKGETLFTDVGVRFTDFTGNKDILKACKVIAERSGIKDVRDIDAGQKIYIPISMLSDRYLPEGSTGREEYKASLREAERLKTNQARSAGLAGVVVILDPGHGGNDPGARHAPTGLYEDELNYDIVCRIRALLQSETGARVYVTVADRSSRFVPTDAKRFSFDKDEELATTPPHRNNRGAVVSANLRWMLANSIYDAELRRGTDSRKIVFTSIHTDSIFNERVRGAMIYIPGAKLRRGEEVRTDSVYARYAEGRQFNRFTSNYAELRRDEALSRNFAVVLLNELGRKRIKRHDQGDPIRSQIRRSKKRTFVPAVLRNTKVPTKILIETANLKNAVDRKRLADPWWRQQFALAYVDALKRYFDAGTEAPTRTARAN